jgi:hypothetical protein
MVDALRWWKASKQPFGRLWNRDQAVWAETEKRNAPNVTGWACNSLSHA